MVWQVPLQARIHAANSSGVIRGWEVNEITIMMIAKIANANTRVSPMSFQRISSIEKIM